MDRSCDISKGKGSSPGSCNFAISCVRTCSYALIPIDTIEFKTSFLDLISSRPNSMSVPTLDIDLVWHTHQLMAGRYGSDCELYVGRYVDQSVVVLIFRNLSKPPMSASSKFARIDCLLHSTRLVLHGR